MMKRDLPLRVRTLVLCAVGAALVASYIEFSDPGPPSASADPLAADLPALIGPSDLGAVTFEESLQTFDDGVDQEAPALPHGWRTVYGAGGPQKPGQPHPDGQSRG